MSEKKQPEFKMWFHKFMVNFALWVFPILGVVYGIRCIMFAVENGARYQALDVIACVLLMGVSAFGIKVRFDMAAFRAGALKEMLAAFLAAAAILLVMHLLYYIPGDEDDFQKLYYAGWTAVWGAGVYRYYKLHEGLFVN